MKAVLLAGGYGTRLRPLTYITNKHLLPIYNKPMIEYGLEALHQAKITDIGVVIGGTKPDEVSRFLGDGYRYGVHLSYIWQGEPKGIAQAVSCARDYIQNEELVVYLGDNIFTEGVADFVDDFREETSDARILVTEVKNPSSYGVIEIENGRIIGLEEKPKKPKSNTIIAGVFCFKPNVFDVIEKLKPSWRNEFEITDTIHEMVGSQEYDVKYSLLKGRWFDCGTFDDILECSTYMKRKMKGR